MAFGVRRLFMSKSLKVSGGFGPDGEQLTEAEPARPAVCANCSTPLQGPICHECGQRADSPMRHLGALVEDMADSFFNFDSRLVRTLPALYLHPGLLTREYFAGRRTRYLPPFRLTFLLSVLAFLAIQFVANGVGLSSPQAGGKDNSFSAASTPAEVNQLLDKNLADLLEAREQVGSIAAAGIDTAGAGLQRQADARIRDLVSSGETNAETGSDKALADWHSRIAKAESLQRVQDLTNQAHAAIDKQRQSKTITALRTTELNELEEKIYQTAGERLTALAASADAEAPQSLKVHAGLLGLFGQLYEKRAKRNMSQFDSDPQVRRRFAAKMLNVSPVVLLAMLPFFGVLLKIMYLFKRRLYVEHLMVALHSHAFIFLSLLLLALASLARSALAPVAGWTQAPLLWLMWGLGVWIPVYLLLMQKHVYQQGWALTLGKYVVLGFAYLLLLTFALVASVLVTLGSM